MATPLDWSLTRGSLPLGLGLTGSLAGCYLLLRRDRRWWIRRVPPAAAGAAILAVGITAWVDRVWRPFPDRLPWQVTMWVGVGLFALGLAVVRWRSVRWRARLLGVGAALLAVLACAVEVNVYFGQFPAVRDAFGLRPHNAVGSNEVLNHNRRLVSADAARPVVTVWQPPADMPAVGLVSQVNIPGTTSGFRPRPGWIYLPPAYLGSVRAKLPVLVLLAGQPGEPRNWLDGGRLAHTLDEFARRNNGLAPVVVIPDDLGATTANPLCMDSKLGRAESYLSRDVPAWIRANLQVDESPERWAIAGLSHGGTCALQLAVRFPRRYPTFIDISGQQEPTLGSRNETVRKAFGGDAAAFRAVNPLDILASRRFEDTVGVLVVGTQDEEYTRQQRVVADACRRSGMRVEWIELPGNHTWKVWGGGLEEGLRRISYRLGLTAA